MRGREVRFGRGMLRKEGGMGKVVGHNMRGMEGNWEMDTEAGRGNGKGQDRR